MRKELEKLIAKKYAFFVSFAFHYFNIPKDDVRDFVHDVIIDALTNSDKFNNPETFGGWFFKLMKNKISEKNLAFKRRRDSMTRNHSLLVAEMENSESKNLGVIACNRDDCDTVVSIVKRIKGISERNWVIYLDVNSMHIRDVSRKHGLTKDRCYKIAVEVSNAINEYDEKIEAII